MQDSRTLHSTSRQEGPDRLETWSLGDLLLMTKEVKKLPALLSTYCVPGIELRTSQPLLVSPYNSSVADIGQEVHFKLWFSWIFLDNQNNCISQVPLQLEKKHLAESQHERDEQK